MKHTTTTGVEISIENGKAIARHPKIGQATLGDASGIRRTWTLAEYNTTFIANGGKKTRAIGAYSGEKKLANVGMDEGTIAFLEANWPVELTVEQRWEASMPTDVKAHREYMAVMADYRRRVERRLEDEARSSFAVAKPKMEDTEMSEESKKWAELDRARNSNLYYEREAAMNEIEKVLEGTETLDDAVEAVKATVKKELDKRIWD